MKNGIATLFDLGPVAVYSCDASGVIQEFNRRAVELWGSEPAAGDTDERFCGSFKLFRPDGRFMPHEQCPMAEVVARHDLRGVRRGSGHRAVRRLADYRRREHPSAEE